MRFACIIVFVAASAIPTPSTAESYKLISSNKAQITLADADSDISQSHGIAKLWSVTLRAPDHFLMQSIAIIKMMNEFDCEENKWRETAMTMYRQDYSLVDNKSMPKEHWRPIPPDTQNEALEKFACGSKAFRQTLPSLGAYPLGKIISSVYSGPWPLK